MGDLSSPSGWVETVSSLAASGERGGYWSPWDQGWSLWTSVDVTNIFFDKKEKVISMNEDAEALQEINIKEGKQIWGIINNFSGDHEQFSR